MSPPVTEGTNCTGLTGSQGPGRWFRRGSSHPPGGPAGGRSVVLADRSFDGGRSLSGLRSSQCSHTPATPSRCERPIDRERPGGALRIARACARATTIVVVPWIPVRPVEMVPFKTGGDSTRYGAPTSR